MSQNKNLLINRLEDSDEDHLRMVALAKKIAGIKDHGYEPPAVTPIVHEPMAEIIPFPTRDQDQDQDTRLTQQA